MTDNSKRYPVSQNYMRACRDKNKIRVYEYKDGTYYFDNEVKTPIKEGDIINNKMVINNGEYHVTHNPNGRFNKVMFWHLVPEQEYIKLKAKQDKIDTDNLRSTIKGFELLFIDIARNWKNFTDRVISESNCYQASNCSDVFVSSEIYEFVAHHELCPYAEHGLSQKVIDKWTRVLNNDEECKSKIEYLKKVLVINNEVEKWRDVCVQLNPDHDAITTGYYFTGIQQELMKLVKANESLSLKQFIHKFNEHPFKNELDDQWNEQNLVENHAQ